MLMLTPLVSEMAQHGELVSLPIWRGWQDGTRNQQNLPFLFATCTLYVVGRWPWMRSESSTTKSKTLVIFFVGYHHQCHWMNWPTNLNQLLRRVIFNEQSQHNSDWAITFCSLNGIFLLTSFYISFSVFCHVYLDTCYSCMSFSIR